MRVKYSMIDIILLNIPYLLLSELLCVHHLDLDWDQSEGLKCQTASVSVVVLHAHQPEQKHNDFPHQNITTYQRKEHLNKYHSF